MKKNELLTAQRNRLKQVLKHLRISRQDLAIKFETTTGYVNQVLAGGNSISAGFREKLSKNYSTINIDWIMNGEGEMLLEKKYDVQPGTLDPHVMEEGEKYEKRKEGLWEAVLRRLEDLESRVKRLEEGKEE